MKNDKVSKSVKPVAAFSLAVPVAFFAAGASGQGASLEEIVVTAQKRSESLQDVPISINAFSDQTIRDAGIRETYELTMVVPGLSVSTTGSATVPYLRGIGSVTAAGGTELPVATFVDGVYHQNGNAANMSLANIERVEVLKGPQGTLFGRNTTGGLIHIVTKDPSQESAAEIRLSAGNYDSYGVNFYGTTGITENLAADLAVGIQKQEEGYYRNLVTGNRQGFTDDTSLRSKWKWSAEKTAVTFIADYIENENSEAFVRYVPPESVGIDGRRKAGGFFELEANTDDQIEITRSWGASIKVEHAFEPFDFMSITAYRDQDVGTISSGFDLDFTPAPMVFGVTNSYYAEYLTQEFQLTSNNEQGNSWIVGLFYMDSDAGSDITLWGNATGNARSRFWGDIATESIAVFGEYTFVFTDETRFTAGLRYTEDSREFTGGRTLTLPGATEPPPTLAPYQEDEWEELTYRAVLSHDWSDNLMLYASYNRGFKSGNFNAVAPGSPSFDPEIVDAYELGFKGTFLDNRLQFNSSLFFYKYDDLQVNIFLGATTQTVNAAEAEILGLEADLIAVVTENFRIDAGFSALDTEYVSFENVPVIRPAVDASGNPTGGNLPAAPYDATGNPLLRVSEFTANIGATYSVSLDSGEITLNLRAAYTEGFPWEADGRLTEDDYVVVNATLGWRSLDDTWGVGVMGRNIFEEKYTRVKNSTGFGDYLNPSRPATYSVYVDYRF
ncbi:MAG: TonB-dependent receptor [Porticoccaceae bacterium]